MKKDRENLTSGVKPCVGCGYCCMTAMCIHGYMLLKKVEVPCPLLFWSEEQNRYLCRKAIVDKNFAKAIGVGAGCCSPLNSWRKDVRRRDRNERRNENYASAGRS